MYELDHTELDALAKKVHDLLSDQRKRLIQSADDVDSQRRVAEGIQTFRLEKRSAVELLREWVGSAESREFEDLQTQLLDQHPSLLAMDYQRREWAKNQVESHAAFLGAVANRIKHGHLQCQGTRVRNDRRTILEVFLERNDKPDADESLRILLEEYGIEQNVLFSHLNYLEEKHFMRKDSNHQEVVTKAGIEELKNMQNDQSESLEQKRLRVLRKLYDMAPDNKHGMVIIYELARELDMYVGQMLKILSYWEEKGMVSFPADEAVSLTAAAIDEIEDKISHPDKPTQHFPSTINFIDNSVNIVGGVAGNVVGGQDNTYQEITNESISAILPKLAEFISQVRSAEFADQNEVISDLEKVYEVASREQITPGTWELIQAKFLSAEAMLKLSRIAYQTYTHWTVLSYFFHQIWR